MLKYRPIAPGQPPVISGGLVYGSGGVKAKARGGYVSGGVNAKARRGKAIQQRDVVHWEFYGIIVPFNSNMCRGTVSENR